MRVYNNNTAKDKEMTDKIYYETTTYKIIRSMGGNYHIMNKVTGKMAGEIITLSGAISYVDEWEEDIIASD